MHETYPGVAGVAPHQAEVFLIEPITNKYLGRLCTFAQCPKPDKLECKTPGCGNYRFMQIQENFKLRPDALDDSASLLLYKKQL